ncbi:hypothetical protein BJ875DRAFT_389777, partial [Amylocarpus encephaloides]
DNIVKLSDEAVVKFGKGVKEEEAKNQRRASELIDPNIVRVPIIYQFFIKERGYLVLEYMHGSVLAPVENLLPIDRITNILAHLAKTRNSIPGAISGGVPCGIR